MWRKYLNIITLEISALIIIFQTQAYPELVVNEIMAVPIEGEPEWIELYNPSSEAYICDECTISDLAVTKVLPYFELPPYSYLVLVKDTTLLKPYYVFSGDEIFIQSIIPALNNTYDALVLRNNDQEIFDSVYYDMKWGEKGKSLERIDPVSPALNSDNWAVSSSSENASPGRFNSQSIIDYDIALSEVKLNENYSSVLLIIRDEGKYKINSFDLSVYADVDYTSNEEMYQLIYSDDNISLEERDITVEIPISSFREKISKNGNLTIRANIYSMNDRRNRNDTIRFSFYIRIEEPVIRINEIMYDVSSDYAEFLEIWNGSGDSLLMDNFIIYDAAGSVSKSNIIIQSNKFVIAPDDYGVICWDSAFFNNYPELTGLNNIYYTKSSFNLNMSGDLIVLCDASGKIYDSLTYSDKWHHNSINVTRNRSLEKISPSLESHLQDNWATCTDIRGATPLKKNSMNIDILDEGGISAEPNPFAPNSVSEDAITVITYSLPYLRSGLNASIYDINGFKVRQISNNRLTGSIGTLLWDGRNDEGYIVQTGQYILIIDATDIDTGKVCSMKMLLVVAS